MAIKLADTARPNNYVDAEHLGTYPVAYAEDIWFADGTRLSDKTFDGESIQKEELPLAVAALEGKIYQYIGVSGTYTNGCFYKCVASGSSYAWVMVDVVKNPVSYMGTPPNYSGDDVADGKVIVYSGEDANGFLKGHHYRWSENFTAEVHEIKCWNESHSSYVSLYIADDVINVGTRLYTRNGDTYWCQAGVVSIDGDNLTIYSVAEGTFTAYGYEIVEDSAVVTIEYSWEDIGGGGDGGNDYEEFVGTQAEWDALSQSQKNKYDGKIVNIIDDVQGTNLDYYSTNEVKTNKVWVDGKPVYRKCWSGLNVSTSETSIGTINNVDIIVNIEASISQYTSTSGTTLSHKKPYVRSQAEIVVKNNTVICKSGSGFDKINIIAIEYTKTTD